MGYLSYGMSCIVVNAATFSRRFLARDSWNLETSDPYTLTSIQVWLYCKFVFKVSLKRTWTLALLKPTVHTNRNGLTLWRYAGETSIGQRLTVRRSNISSLANNTFAHWRANDYAKNNFDIWFSTYSHWFVARREQNMGSATQHFFFVSLFERTFQ